MSETLVTNPVEQRIEPTGNSAAVNVFNGIYESFAARAKRSRVEHNELTAEEERAVATKFVQARFDAAEKYIEPIDNQPTRPTDVYNSFFEEAENKARETYQGRPEAVGLRMERARRVVAGFTDRASQLFQDDKTAGLTIKLFFGRMHAFKHGLSLGYNGLVTKTDESTPGREAQARYAHAIHNNFVGRENVEEQASGAFLHVNAHRQDSVETTERYYISPKLNAKPEEVVKAWTDTLATLGLEDKLYYKVAEGLARRYDTLIAYASPETAEEMEEAIHKFSQRCPDDLLSDTTMPSGVAIAKGIVRAPEPHELNTLLRYRGKEAISYNELACALTELALQRASFEFMKQGVKADSVRPRALAEAARPYFEQLITLSGLDPATMKVA